MTTRLHSGVIPGSQKIDSLDVLKGLIVGAIGGLVASGAMSAFQWGLSKLSSQESEDEKQQDLHERRQQRLEQQPQSQQRESSEPESQPAEDEPATVKTAQAISTAVFQHELGEEEKEVAGAVVHYAYGTLIGGFYGAASEIAPIITTGSGTVYGTAAFILGDEIAVPALRLSRPPTQHPPSTHAYAFASHLVYGLTLEAVRAGLRKVL